MIPVKPKMFCLTLFFFSQFVEKRLEQEQQLWVGGSIFDLNSECTVVVEQKMTHVNCLSEALIKENRASLIFISFNDESVINLADDWGKSIVWNMHP